MAPRVQTGLERLLSGQSDVQLSGRKVGLIANPSSITKEVVNAVTRFAEAFELVALFGPEHGIRGNAQYMVSVDTEADARGLQVHSLYGSTEESLTPTPASLADIDVLVFDIQDVGSRYYTYVWTMVLAMRACARAGVSFVVLDRPNPIGGAHIEGGAIESGFDSFVGLRSLPNRHGLTACEIATWAAREEALDLDLHCVTMRGWQREMHFSDTGLPWVMPSPNMPTQDTALVYPGMCLLEGTNISEGRGTTRPFECSGASYVDGDALAGLLAKQDLPGVAFRPMTFTPTFDKFEDVACDGIQQHILNRETYLPYKTGVAIVWAVRTLWQDEFAWRRDAYEFVDDVPAFDLLAGSAALREGIDAGAHLTDLASTWAPGQDAFAKARPSWLLY